MQSSSMLCGERAKLSEPVVVELDRPSARSLARAISIWYVR